MFVVYPPRRRGRYIDWRGVGCLFRHKAFGDASLITNRVNVPRLPFYTLINTSCWDARSWECNMNPQTQWRFLQLYCMVVADGIIDASELQTLYRIGRENYGLSPDEISEAVTEAGIPSGIPDRLNDQVQFLYELALIAWADGVIEDSEKELLCRYALKMGFLESNIAGIIDFLLEKAQHNAPIEEVLSEINPQ